ncbi:hypothetical protein GMES_1309 [Paraglaciecola mesophila KMM 241]|uniref:Uncharacterized protein n=1 Tax=Paraglaciecola mesophila KMM 241 TaxID=1128912 RepID=K6Z3M6_9ALTE|nr:hypothetical protein GMES_1309 [Paraglaciecola mesophila KMM 241]
MADGPSLPKSAHGTGVIVEPEFGNIVSIFLAKGNLLTAHIFFILQHT